jgi:hypothetical protein
LLDETKSCRRKLIVQGNLTHSLSAKTLLLALSYRRFMRAAGGQLCCCTTASVLPAASR